MRIVYPLSCLILVSSASLAWGGKKSMPVESPLDRFIRENGERAAAPVGTASPGSLWSPAARFSELALDIRASRVDDIVTVQVAERASAVAKGTTKSARASDVKSGVNALGGILSAKNPLTNLIGLSGQTKLDGQGETTRETLLTATVTARVTNVLSNGYLVIQGTKNITVNSEVQLITVRGIVRPADLNTSNIVSSDRLGEIEVKVNGKGVIGDAVRRPMFLYRLLLGLLPF